MVGTYTTTEDIQVLHGLDPVRYRPGMYVGSTCDGSGLHHLVFIVVEQAVDEAIEGRCHDIRVTLHEGGAVTVEADGRGLPVDPDPRSGRPVPEVVLTQLSGPGRSRGRHVATGSLAIANALSETLRYEVVVDGEAHVLEFSGGEPSAPMSSRPAPAQRSGTTIHFRPDPLVFQPCELSWISIADRLHDLAHLVPGLTTTLVDKRTGSRRVVTRGDVAGWVATLAEGRRRLHPEPITLAGRDGEQRVEVTLLWTAAAGEDLHAFVNGSATPRGGTHVDGLHRALMTTLAEWAHRLESPMLPVGTQGLVAVLSVWIPEPRFDHQLRDHLVSPATDILVETIVARGLRDWLDRHPDEATAIVTGWTRASMTELEDRLRGYPDDAATALVHADALQASADPRGELIALEHALRTEPDPVARDAMDTRAATLLDHDRARLWARPGGFPFRPSWRGRAFVQFARIEELQPRPVYARVQRFLEELTDSAGPHFVELSPDSQRHDALSALGFTVRPVGRRPRWVRPLPTVSTHDDFAALVEPGMRLGYGFVLCDPASHVRLPYQRAGWYAHGRALTSSLSIELDTGRLDLELQLPFESDRDDDFVRYCEAISDCLGQRLSADGVRVRAPGPYGRG